MQRPCRRPLGEHLSRHHVQILEVLKDTQASWIALFNGWRLEQHSPEGKELGEVCFPYAHVIKLTFGGENLQTLNVTTVSTGLFSDDRQQ